MNKNEMLVEFYNIKHINKFAYAAPITFGENDAFAGHWYHVNAKEIEKGRKGEGVFASQSDICEAIHEQLIEYKKYALNKPSFSTMVVSYRKFYLKEMLECEDLNKFNPESNVCFSSGDSMSEFFSSNYEYIISNNSKDCIELLMQYEEYKKLRYRKTIEKRIADKKALMISEKKKMVSFYREESDLKFDPLDKSILFFDNTPMSVWFNEHIDTIVSSQGVLETAITEQYEKFKLKEEFIDSTDYLKFSDTDCVLFENGESMNIWWEENRDYVISNNKGLNSILLNQYKEYCKMLGIKVLKK